MKRDLDYYKGLPYKIEITPIPEHLGGGYNASIPQFGKYALHADGDTIEEAINNLNEYKQHYIKRLLENDVAIPEPISEEEYSGKFVLRLEPWLHKIVKEKSKKEGLSLNQYIKTILVANLRQKYEEKEIHKEIRACFRKLEMRLESLEEAFPQGGTSLMFVTPDMPGGTFGPYPSQYFITPATAMLDDVRVMEIIETNENNINDTE